ncbi:isoprenylcysteine carboxylmethyltransferase family protein [bacterium]|nr:isoprenylcysteine carboxylmethyltransferase family protein [bacterium]MBU4361555.1 isoprenylcysteine carboxylmethyltransferase family protein [bacterium]
MKIRINQNMSMDVKIRAIIRVIFILGLMFATLFISAGRWDYWYGWAYFLLWIYAVLFSWLIIPSELVQERIKPGPGSKKWDYVFYAFYLPLTYIIPLIAALDGGRYHWTGDFPLWVNVLAFIIIFLGYSLEILSLWKNRFFSSTVRIQKERGHCVIDKGPYAFIRHPGYAGVIISSFGIAIALNSLWALIPAGLYTIAFIIRTYLEDVTLQKELPGYADYAARVKYRLLPRIW